MWGSGSANAETGLLWPFFCLIRPALVIQTTLSYPVHCMNIIFDLDGTLIDSAPDIQAAASAALGRHGKRGLTLDETRSFIGEGSAVFVSRMMAVRGIDETPERHALLYADFMTYYETAVDQTVFYPGVRDLLAAFKAEGHKLGLCTNKPEQPARAVIRYMGMNNTFDAFVAGGMIKSRKPEPDMLLRTIEDLGGGATLYVGDSETDALTAKRADVPFALYSGGYRKTSVSEIHHDWVFDDFGALQGIVAQAQNKL
jgi:phosphoglycolate phosphatase